MPFRAILQKLVENVEGAVSAILIEADGEAVQWFTVGDDEQLRLRAAYVVIAAVSGRETLNKLGVKREKPILMEYAGATFIVEELDKNYYLILEILPTANVAIATYKFLPVAEQLRKEIA
ncbi:MAG: hypothetical protein AB1757_26045 [Acidobacteriota bacterium]